MNLEEAKSLIARYLTGQPVAVERLRVACEAVRPDWDYLQHLRQELGLHDDWSSDCDSFLANVAELSELSRSQREREMPELVTHLAACDTCRRAYWSINPAWVARSADALKENAGQLRKELAEQICLAFDELGNLIEQGFGPPASSPELVFGTMSGGGEFFPSEAGEQERKKQWSLADEESGWVVQFETEACSETEVSFRCSIRRKFDELLDASGVRIEVWDAQNKALHLAGALGDFAQEPLVLTGGSWLLRLQTSDKDGELSWEIPLRLRPAGKIND
jgi:hypothetical protein